jgi:DNA-binding HxlR family transcriptional regulator
LEKEHWKDFQKLDGLIDTVRAKVRELLDKHQEEIRHDQERKELELEIFFRKANFISKKWVVDILWELEINEGLHFNALMRHLKGISSRSLSKRLKTLKKHGLISRTVLDTSPPRVLYDLTAKGRGFIELSLPMIWYLVSNS